MPAQLTWTPSDSGITEIKSYSIFRNVDAGDYALLIECAVLRDMFGGIIGVQGCTTNHSPNDDTGQVREKFIEDAPVTYVDSTVLPGHAYCYYVQGNPLGNTDYTGSGPPSPPSNIGCVTVLAQATAPVLGGALVSADVVLTWTAATVVGSTISGYEVHRNVDGGVFSLLTTVGNVLTYTDLAPASGHTYGYYVIAIPVVGLNSNPSNTVFETPAAGGLNFTIVAGQVGNPCCTCPCNPPSVVGFTTADVGAPIGSIAPTTLFGNPIWSVSWTGGVFTVIISSWLPQNEFATLTIHDSLLGEVVFTTAAAANYAQGQSGVPPNADITVWHWIPGGHLFADGQTYHLTVT